MHRRTLFAITVLIFVPGLLLIMSQLGGQLVTPISSQPVKTSLPAADRISPTEVRHDASADHEHPQAPSRSETSQIVARGPQPKAVVPRTEFDFGTADPETLSVHTFVIRNAGNAPLKLTQGNTTCKCTISDLADGAIPPGKDTQVRLTWKTKADHVRFEHAATVLTNDPDMPAIQFRVSGDVLRHLASYPDKVVFSRLTPGEAGETETIVFSEVWEDLDFEKVETNVPGLTWEFEELEKLPLAIPYAKAGRRLKLSVPGDLPEGYFGGFLTFTTTKPDGEPYQFELGVQGKVLRRLSVHGSVIDQSGTIRLGDLTQGESKTVRLMMKYLSTSEKLRVGEITVQPEFVKVTVEPYRETETAQLFRLEITVPDRAPEFRQDAVNGDHIHIAIDNESADDLHFPLKLRVSNRRLR